MITIRPLTVADKQQAKEIWELRFHDSLSFIDWFFTERYSPETSFCAEENGRIVSIHRGVSETGRLNVVALNVGERDGLERGHVLSLFRNRGTAEYRGEAGKESFQLPEKRYGVVFVFRVFERVSYALVMESDGPVTIADAVRKP